MYINPPERSDTHPFRHPLIKPAVRVRAQKAANALARFWDMTQAADKEDPVLRASRTRFLHSPSDIADRTLPFWHHVRPMGQTHILGFADGSIIIGREESDEKIKILPVVLHLTRALNWVDIDMPKMKLAMRKTNKSSCAPFVSLTEDPDDERINIDAGPTTGSGHLRYETRQTIADTLLDEADAWADLIDPISTAFDAHPYARPMYRTQNWVPIEQRNAIHDVCKEFALGALMSLPEDIINIRIDIHTAQPTQVPLSNPERASIAIELMKNDRTMHDKGRCARLAAGLGRWIEASGHGFDLDAMIGQINLQFGGLNMQPNPLHTGRVNRALLTGMSNHQKRTLLKKIHPFLPDGLAHW